MAPERDRVVQLKVTSEEQERMRQLAEVAYGLGCIEQPTFSALIQLGLTVVWDQVNRSYREIRDRKEGA